MGTLEDRAGANRKVFLALIAAVVAIFTCRYAVAKSANRTTASVNPEARFQIFAPSFGVWDHLEKLKCAYGYLVIHSQIPLLIEELCAKLPRESSI